MKKNFYSLLMILSLALVMNGCRKDNNKPAQNYPFTAKLNGVPFNATTTYCMLNVDSSMHFRYFVLMGMYQDQTLSITFLDSVLTEVIDSTTSLNWFGVDISFTDTSTSTLYIPISSTLAFSKFDTLTKKTSGTFSGTLIGTNNVTMVVSDGKFHDIPYTWEYSN